jgi:hypothetical protein
MFGKFMPPKLLHQLATAAGLFPPNGAITNNFAQHPTGQGVVTDIMFWRLTDTRRSGRDIYLEFIRPREYIESIQREISSSGDCSPCNVTMSFAAARRRKA